MSKGEERPGVLHTAPSTWKDTQEWGRMLSLLNLVKMVFQAELKTLHWLHNNPICLSDKEESQFKPSLEMGDSTKFL